MTLLLDAPARFSRSLPEESPVAEPFGVTVQPGDPATDSFCGRDRGGSATLSDEDDEDLEDDVDTNTGGGVGDFEDFDEEDFDDEFDDDFEGELEDEYELSEFEDVTEEDLIERDDVLPLSGDLVDEDAEDEPAEPAAEDKDEDEKKPEPKGKKGKAKGKKAKDEDEDELDDEDE